MYKFFALLAFFGCSLVGRIEEIATIQELQLHVQREANGYAPSEILVLLDIDNTVACPHTDLGADQWFEYKVQQNRAAGHDLHGAIALVLPHYFYIHFKIPLRTVEDDTRHVVHALQAAGFNVVCVTARSLYIAERTVEQLDHIGLRFSFMQIAQDMPLRLAHPAVYKHGIIFCGLNDKGESLMHFLESVEYKPKKIIMIDDKAKYLHAVEKAAGSKNIDMLGLRYGYCDAAVAAYDHAQAECDWLALRHK